VAAERGDHTPQKGSIGPWSPRLEIGPRTDRGATEELGRGPAASPSQRLTRKGSENRSGERDAILRRPVMMG